MRNNILILTFRNARFHAIFYKKLSRLEFTCAFNFTSSRHEKEKEKIKIERSTCSHPFVPKISIPLEGSKRSAKCTPKGQEKGDTEYKTYNAKQKAEMK